MSRPNFEREFRGQPVLVTGGLGFIGSNLARRLADLGARVTVLDALLPQFGGNLFNLDGYEKKLTVTIGDLRDERVIRAVVPNQAFIFNLAGQVSHLDSMQNPLADLDINCRSQLHLLEACRQLNPNVRIIYASTRQVYGKPQFLPATEEHPLAPVDINGIHKQAGDWYHILYHRVYGLRATSLRMTNTYGPRMRVVDARQTFLGLWFRQVIDGAEFLVYGDGSQKRDFNYVDDAVEALLLTAITRSAEGQFYNLGSHEVVSLSDLGRLLVELNGSGSFRQVPFPPERLAIDIGDYYADYTKIQTTLGWEPTVPLREGLLRTLQYYRACHRQYW